MKDLIEALKRRRVFRVAGAYAVVAWVFIEVSATVVPELGLPDWTARAVILVALGGFPVALALAWAFDLSPEGMRRGRWVVAGIALGLGLSLVYALEFGGGGLDADGARALVAESRALAEEGRFLEAYGLAERAEEALGEDSALVALWEEVSDTVFLLSDPAGARVFAVAWEPGGDETPDDARLLGETPLEGIRLPRASHHLRFELPGYRTAERPLSSVVHRSLGNDAGRLVISVRMEPEEGASERFVRVPGGDYEMTSADLPPGLEAALDEFLIGRYEVTNREYAEFIAEGGYADRAYWEHDFVTGEGERLSYEDAMSRLVDRTGLPGPRAWVGQRYPEGEDDYPVTGVTWYEAAAYASFRGASLPTAFQWEKAARDGQYSFYEEVVLPWGAVRAGEWDARVANFQGSGPTSVDRHPFGVSPYGAYGMAGNVAEWLANPSGEGYAVTGGGWDGPMHLFGEFSGVAPFHSSPSIGFRIVRLESGRRRLGTDQGLVPLSAEPVVPRYEPVDEETARSYLSHYRYDPVPPDGRVEEAVDAGNWIRETVSFAGPGGVRLAGYLYLPKTVPPPYQTLLYVAGASTFFGTPVTENIEWVMGPLVQSGRAVFTVVLDGMVGNPRPEGWVPPDPTSVRFRDELVRHAIQLRMGIDYLETRSDIDMERFGYSAFSMGAGSRSAFMAADDRFKLAFVIGAGIDERVRPTLPEVDPVNFLPYLDFPILVVQGRHDEEHPYFTRFLPHWNLLPDGLKELHLVPGAGHMVPPEDRIPAANRFLDEHFGPVAR